jgi:hypothetical protein
MPEIRDFSKKRKQLFFRVDDDTFEATSAIPAEVMIQFAERITTADPSTMTPKEQVAIFRDMLEMVLLPESMAVMRKRMADARNPVDMQQLDEIIQWLFEEYGMRPTVDPSSSSSGDSPLGSGTTLTAATPGVGLISAASPSTGS